MDPSIKDLYLELLAAGQPFAIATVVRAEKPTSAKSGAKALVTADGELAGWIGGSCAEPTVRREARRAIHEGRPRLIRLCPPEERGRGPQVGVEEITLTCISGGTLEIYIEPQLAQPHLVIIGHLATAEALVAAGRVAGWRVSVMGLDLDPARFGQANERVDALDFERLSVTTNSAVVVASHGNYDEDMVVAALHSPAWYVALVASHKRAEAMLHYLHESDLTHDQIQRLKFPAGLDIGAETPGEIAVSIVAEIIQFRAHAAGDSSVDVPEPAAAMEADNGEAIDPVCGMTVEIASAHFTSEYGGSTYYFCAAGCKRSFDADPQKYLQQETHSDH